MFISLAFLTFTAVKIIINLVGPFKSGFSINILYLYLYLRVPFLLEIYLKDTIVVSKEPVLIDIISIRCSHRQHLPHNPTSKVCQTCRSCFYKLFPCFLNTTRMFHDFSVMNITTNQ